MTLLLQFTGDDKIDVVEEGGVRTIKKTGVYSGTKLQIFFLQPFYDERLESKSDGSLLSFDVKSKEIITDEHWSQACKIALCSLNLSALARLRSEGLRPPM